MLEGRTGAVLRSHLHHPLGPPRHVQHPAALANEQRQRFLHVDVLAGRAGHHRHQRVPVIGRGHVHGVDVLVVQQVAEIGVFRRLATGHLGSRLDASPMDIAHGGDLRVGLRLDSRQMESSDQSKADQSDMDALIRAQYALRG